MLGFSYPKHMHLLHIQFYFQKHRYCLSLQHFWKEIIMIKTQRFWNLITRNTDIDTTSYKFGFHFTQNTGTRQTLNLITRITCPGTACVCSFCGRNHPKDWHLNWNFIMRNTDCQAQTIHNRKHRHCQCLRHFFGRYHSKHHHLKMKKKSPKTHS